jgi:hypothetical protein
MNKLLLVLSLFATCSASATAFTKHNFMPKNVMYIAPGAAEDGISQEDFNKALDAFEKEWRPVVEKKGLKLQINRLWEDGTVNSDTDVENGVFIINSYGGLARYKGITYDGYMLVACHELGHHLAGAPIFAGEPGWGGGGPSIEGESDYWATLKCAKIMMKKNMNRVTAASLSLAGVLADLEGSPMPKVDTPDSSVVTEIYEAHPQAQCRLDTYIAGMRCRASGNMSDKDARVGSCYKYKYTKSSVGSRPLCWFKPE